MPSIHFTKEQKTQASSVDLEAFLLRQGEKLLASGREKRMASDHSVTIRGNQWYDHASQRGGGPVSFVRSYYGLSYPEAMTLLLGGDYGQVYPTAQPKEKTPKPFVLPPRNFRTHRIYAYLVKRRRIDPWIVNHFVREKLLYEDADHHNCVFVGRDENGTPRHAHCRSSNSFGKPFRINVEGSDPRCSFHHLGTSGQLYVFEAPIDLMSYLTLHPENWQAHSYIACCGTSFQPVEWMLSQMELPETVFLCLDNDKAGRLASRRMEEKLTEMGLSSQRLIPICKDWNEDLTENCQPEQVVNMVQQL